MVRVHHGSPKHRCPYRLAWSRTSPFHGGDRGSNPLRDASMLVCEHFLRLLSGRLKRDLNGEVLSVTLGG